MLEASGTLLGLSSGPIGPAGVAGGGSEPGTTSLVIGAASCLRAPFGEMLVLADLEGCSYQLVFGADYNTKGGDGKGPGRGKPGLEGNARPSWALPGNVRPSRGVAHTPRLREGTSGRP